MNDLFNSINIGDAPPHFPIGTRVYVSGGPYLGKYGKVTSGPHNCAVNVEVLARYGDSLPRRETFSVSLFDLREL